jgi:hypothetical protein
VIEPQNGIALVDAPLYDERDHHGDHSAGARTLVANGAEIEATP